MSTEEVTTTEEPQVEEQAVDTQDAQPTEETAQEDTEVIKLMRQFSPDQQEYLYGLAVEEHNRRLNSEGATPPKPVTQEQSQAAGEDKKESISEYESLKKEVEDLKGKLSARERAERNEASRRAFNGAVDNALIEAGVESPKARKILLGAYTVQYSQDKPAVLGTHLAKWIKEEAADFKGNAKPEKEEPQQEETPGSRLKRKIADARKTRTETGSGAAPKKEPRKFTRHELNTGVQGDHIKRELGLA